MSLDVSAFQSEAWTVSLNDAISIYITGDDSAQSFKPLFTYPIFGEAEVLYGYKDLEIFLCFDAKTFLPFLNVRFSAALPDVQVDPKEKMLAVLPKCTVFKDELKWREAIDNERKDYQIPGDLYTQYGDFSVYKLHRGANLLERLQVLVLLFIEAGSYIDASDPLWDIYVLYKNDEIVGFCTAYNYWRYPGHEAFNAGKKTTRKKISQFVILPNHQGKHYGGDFYLHLYKEWLKDDNVFEIVVEDPNESFDDLRDRVDLSRILEEKLLEEIDILNIPSWFDDFKAAQKFEKRQLQRLVEMVLIVQLQRNVGTETWSTVRRFIKRRLYEKNHEALAELDNALLKDKLQTAYEVLEKDYERILAAVAVRAKRPLPADEPEPKRR